MKTTMLKLSTMAISLLAIALGVQLQGPEPRESALAFSSPMTLESSALSPSTAAQPPTARLPLERDVASPTVPTAFDPIIIPGQSAGPITAETRYGDLPKLFDAARLTEVDAQIGEGFTRPGTRVDLGDRRSFTIIWNDANRTQVAEVRDLGADWHTPEGIQAGMSLKELETILGPFQLYGFAWDYGGTVMLKGTSLNRYESQLIVRLQPTPADTQQSQAFRAVIGDQLFESSHTSFDKIHPVVDELIVSLATP
jgi:hypothetical protein